MTENEFKIYNRVKEEYIQLCEKISLLELALFDDTLEISNTQFPLLRRQLLEMRKYKDCLLDRIKDLTRNCNNQVTGGES